MRYPLALAILLVALPTTLCAAFNRNLKMGDTGEDVRALQVYLNSKEGTRIASSGVGSPGYERDYYGPLTARAVTRLQELYASSILTPLNLVSGTGVFGTATRTYVNSHQAETSQNSQTAQ